jgi:hypothetical protein
VHDGTGGFKAKIKKPKTAAGAGGCVVVLVVVGLMRNGGGGGDGAGPANRFVNTTVTLESANTVDECLSSPCLNGGTCVDLIDSYGCDCVSGFSGTECQMTQEAHCPADNSCDAEHALCVAGGGGGSRRPPPPPPPSPARPPPPPPATGLCEDDAAFRDGASLQCSDYRGYGCDDTSSSGGTASAAIKAACPLSCGICSGEFRQPLCAWDTTYTFQRCCDTASGPTGDAECWYAETQYASCCLPEEGQAPRPPPPPSPPSRPPPPPPVLPPPPPPAGGCVSQPCQNAGVCAEAGALSYSCECPAGFAGDDCEDDTSTHSDDDASHDTADDTCYPCPHYIPAPTETPCDDWMAVRKTPFRAHFMLSHMIILPRQARDKHRNS